MGSGASIPTSVEDALQAGYSQAEIDAYMKTNAVAAPAAAATNAGGKFPSETPDFAKRVKALFAYIDQSIDERNEDGHIIMAELVTFFGETGTKADAERNAKYWLNEMDGYGDNSGYITLDEMFQYFDSLTYDEAVEALENLEAYEGYDAAGNDIRNQSPEFVERVKDLFEYIDESIDERNADGYISTEELVAFFGSTGTNKTDAAGDASYWLKEIDGYGENDGYITLNEMLDYFDSLSAQEAVQALEELEAYEGYEAKGAAAAAAPAAPAANAPSKFQLVEFKKRVKALFAYIDQSIDERNEDGYITTEELTAFFGETGTTDDATENAKYWLNEIDSYGENDGYITLDEMNQYFASLSYEEAVKALENLEAYEGYDAAGNDIRNQSPEFVERVKDLFAYIDETVDDRNSDGYITTEELVKFFGDTGTNKNDAARDAAYWLKEIDGYGENNGYITLNEMLDYFDSLSAQEAVQALEELEAYEGYEAKGAAAAAAPAAPAANAPSKFQLVEFKKRVKALFAYIDQSIDERNEDGYITTEELTAFFGETGTTDDATENAKYWLNEIDSYGENDGYITLDEMNQYFASLSYEEAVKALENLEAYEGYDAAGNDIRNQSPEFVERVKDLFAYIDETVDDRNSDGYITTEELVKFFGDTGTNKNDAARDAAYWLKEIDGYGENNGYITLNEMLDYFDSLSAEEAVEALENLEAYEHYAAKGGAAAAPAANAGPTLPSQYPEFAKRVKALFAYIDESIDERNEDGYITTAELVKFFGETCAGADAVENAEHFIKEIDGFGETDGYITLDEMFAYFDSLSYSKAQGALASLEAYEGYDAAGNDIRSHSPEFIKRVEDLFAYIDESIDARNEDGYITTEELRAFFGETVAKGDAARTSRYWLGQIDGYGENDGYITLDEMLKYFSSISVEEAVEALESLEAYEGYEAGEVKISDTGEATLDI